ncbi:MAG: YdcF family protein [Pseudonocardiaceae bacterium]
MALARMNSTRIRAVEMFGLMMRAVSGRYRIDGNTDTAQCVVALAFGYRLIRAGVREPGPCNEYLAARALTTSNGRPIVAQAEIDQAIRSVRPSIGADHVIGSARDPKRYLDTYELAVQVHAIMNRYGWKTAVLIAHPHHLPRAQAVFSTLGIHTVTCAGVRPIWDSKSSQSWTRGPLRWAIREPFAIWLSERRGWLRLSRPEMNNIYLTR